MTEALFRVPTSTTKPTLRAIEKVSWGTKISLRYDKTCLTCRGKGAMSISNAGLRSSHLHLHRSLAITTLHPEEERTHLPKQRTNILQTSKSVKMPRKSKFTEVFSESALQQLIRESNEAERALAAEERGQQPQAPKNTPVIKTKDVRRKPVIVEPPLQAIPERAIFCGAGQNESADRERSDTIKRHVARPRPSGDRPRASGELHRSNAIHIPSRSASMRVGDLHRSNAVRVPPSKDKK